MSTIRRSAATSTSTSDTPAMRPPTRESTGGPTRHIGSPGAGIRALLKRHAETRSNAYPEVKADETKRVIAFVDDDMFAAWYFHWVERVAKGKRKSWLCLANPSAGDFVGGDPDDERGCPLCEVNDPDMKKPQFKAAFNVVALHDWDKADPEVAVLECGVTLAGLITDAAESDRTKPINRPDVAFVLSRTSTGEGSNAKYTFQLPPIKTRDVEEDFSVQPLSDEQRADLLKTRYTKEAVVKIDTYEDLRELVEELYG